MFLCPISNYKNFDALELCNDRETKKQTDFLVSYCKGVDIFMQLKLNMALFY